MASIAVTNKRPNLDGVTLEMMVTRLSEKLGWVAMGDAIPVRCFTHDPSISSSLKFLRRTPWARAKVEALYAELVSNMDT
ncbi:MAG: VF530 family protein [Gallionella sp.]